MAYLTPEERKARARAIISQEPQQNKSWTDSPAAVPLKVLGTYVDMQNTITEGGLKTVEGVADWVLGGVGAVGGLISKDFQEGVREAIEYDVVGNTFGKVADATYGKLSYIENGKLPDKILKGVGGMLPAVAVTIATGGAGAPAAFSQAASLATTAAGAAGQATEEAFNDGASYLGGLGYGTAVGAVEAGTEKLFGGATKALYGKGLLDGIGSSVAKKGIAGYAGKVVSNFAQEAGEEMLAEAVDPFLQGIYKGKIEGIGTPEYFKNIGEAGLVGGTVGTIFGESIGRAMTPSSMADTTIKSATEKIDNLNAQENRRFINNTLEQRQSQIDRDRLANYKVIEEVLKKSPNRETLIQRYNLPYDAQGNLNAGLATKLQGVQTPTQSENAPKSELAYSEKYYSPSLRGTNINERLAEQGTRVYFGELTTEEQTRYDNFKKIHDKLSKKGLVSSDFVITETSDKFNSYIDGKTIVIGKDNFESDKWQDKLVHEVEHFTEGTKEWAEYADFIFNETDTTQAIQSVLSKGYGVTQADVDTLQDALQKGELTQGQKTLINEVVAMQSESMFGSEEAINRLTRSNKTLAQKIYNKIKDFIQVLKSTPEEKYIIKKLQTAEKLFEKALSQAGAKSDTQYSLKDAEYMKAVESGDMETAQKMVDEKAREAMPNSKWVDKNGKLISFYHGTNAEFTVFDKSYSTGTGNFGDGFYFGKKDLAELYGKSKKFYLNVAKPYGFYDETDIRTLFKELEKREYKYNKEKLDDAIDNTEWDPMDLLDDVIEDTKWKGSYRGSFTELIKSLEYDGVNAFDEFVVFSPNQIKSADPVTYDDNGNIIPLSERFKDSNNDIRYSLKDGEKTDKKPSLDGLSDAQRTKKLANVGRQKVYTKTDAKTLIDGVLSKYEKKDTFKSEEKAEAVTKIFEALNTVGKENYVKVAENMADYIIDNALNVENRTTTRQEMAKEIVKFFNELGKASKVFVTEAKYKEVDSRNTAINRLVGRGGTLDKLRDIKLGTFLNKSQYKTDIFKGSIEQLTKILNRGHLNESGTRKILAEFSEWYNKDNPILATDPTDDKPYGFSQEMKDNIDAIANGEGELNTYELKALDNIIRHSIHIVQNFDKVWKGDKWIGKKDEAKTKVIIEQNNAKIKVGWLSKIAPKISDQVTKYFQYWGDPTAIARRASLYDENGFFVTAVDMITDAEVQTNIDVMNIRRDLDAFKKENKHYERDFKKRTVEYLGHKLPVNNAILAYMSLKREQAHLGMARNGFTYTDQNGKKVRLGGIAPQVKTAEEAKAVSEEAQKNLYKQFSEADKKYIEIAEKIFNEECKPRKEKMDIQRKGYSNIIEGYYVPLRRANIAKSVDVSYVDELNSVTNPSFNKNTVQGAQGELFIGSIDEVLNRHIKSIAIYLNMAPVIDYYDAVYNYDTGDNPNRPISVATENNWQRNDKTKTIGGDEYIKNMIADIKGHASKQGVLNFIRKGYAKFQLGLNPKVWATQLSSFFAASKILDNTSIMQGVGIKSSDVNKYAPIAELRANDNIAAMSQGVMYAVEEAGNWSMSMIGKADRLVVKKLFGACQVQVEKNTGLKIGTEENKIKAGEMLQEVILETQQNSFMTSRSQAMRDDNVYTLFTMFSADAMKLFGRVVDGAGKVSVLKAKIKTADAQTKTALESELKQANKQATKAVGAMMSVAVFMAVIAKAFRWLYKKEEDKDSKEKMETFVVDAVGNMFGGLPVIRDVVGRLTQGYEIDSYAFSTLNNLADSVMKMGDLIANAGNLDENDIPRALKDVLYTGGQLLGIPTRNVYNVVSGLTKRFIPTAGYEMESMFYNKNYRSDLERAIKNDDEDMIATIAGIMTDENIGIKDAKIRKETKSLVEKGYDVLPRSIGDKITYNDEEITLTTSQKKQFKEVYNGAYKEISTLMSSTFYANASDEVKAKAIAFIYSMYYNKAKETILGVQIDSKASLFAKAISIDKLAIAIATANSFTADLDRNGKAITGTKKAKVQKYVNSLRMTAAEKYMIMGYLGYKNEKGDTQVKAYIQKQRMTAEQKKTLYAYSGY